MAVTHAAQAIMALPVRLIAAGSALGFYLAVHKLSLHEMFFVSSRNMLQSVSVRDNLESMKKPRPIRNVAIRPSTHDLVRAAKKRTGLPVKVLVDRALVNAYGKLQASA